MRAVRVYDAQITRRESGDRSMRHQNEYSDAAAKLMPRLWAARTESEASKEIRRSFPTPNRVGSTRFGLLDKRSRNGLPGEETGCQTPRYVGGLGPGSVSSGVNHTGARPLSA